MNRKFTDEFKKDAVRLANEIGAQEAADKLDVKIKNIYTWRKAERVANGQVSLKGLLPGETAEQAIKRLEKEANELRQANEVLRKALGYIHPIKPKPGFMGTPVIAAR